MQPVLLLLLPGSSLIQRAQQSDIHSTAIHVSWVFCLLCFVRVCLFPGRRKRETGKIHRGKNKQTMCLRWSIDQIEGCVKYTHTHTHYIAIYIHTLIEYTTGQDLQTDKKRSLAPNQKRICFSFFFPLPNFVHFPIPQRAQGRATASASYKPSGKRARERERESYNFLGEEKKSKSLDDGGGGTSARLTPPPSFALLPAFASFLFQKKEKKKKQVAGAMGKAVGPSRQPRTVHALNLRAFLKREKRFYYKEEI